MGDRVLRAQRIPGGRQCSAIDGARSVVVAGVSAESHDPAVHGAGAGAGAGRSSRPGRIHSFGTDGVYGGIADAHGLTCAVKNQLSVPILIERLLLSAGNLGSDVRVERIAVEPCQRILVLHRISAAGMRAVAEAVSVLAASGCRSSHRRGGIYSIGGCFGIDVADGLGASLSSCIAWAKRTSAAVLSGGRSRDMLRRPCRVQTGA